MLKIFINSGVKMIRLSIILPILIFFLSSVAYSAILPKGAYVCYFPSAIQELELAIKQDDKNKITDLTKPSDDPRCSVVDIQGLTYSTIRELAGGVLIRIKVYQFQSELTKVYAIRYQLEQAKERMRKATSSFNLAVGTYFCFHDGSIDKIATSFASDDVKKIQNTIYEMLTNHSGKLRYPNCFTIKQSGIIYSIRYKDPRENHMHIKFGEPIEIDFDTPKYTSETTSKVTLVNVAISEGYVFQSQPQHSEAENAVRDMIKNIKFEEDEELIKEEPALVFLALPSKKIYFCRSDHGIKTVAKILTFPSRNKDISLKGFLKTIDFNEKIPDCFMITKKDIKKKGIKYAVIKDEGTILLAQFDNSIKAKFKTNKGNFIATISQGYILKSQLMKK